VVYAQVPLAEMASYATTLRSLTSGRAGYQAQLDHYDFVPFQNAEKIIKERKDEKEKA
jgi:elongation factor G